MEGHLMAKDEKDYVETIKDPLIELLAIKLFEHDHDIEERYDWLMIPNVAREIYRKMARGEEPIGEGHRLTEEEARHG
jgi:hypothetical protein